MERVLKRGNCKSGEKPIFWRANDEMCSASQPTTSSSSTPTPTLLMPPPLNRKGRQTQEADLLLDSFFARNSNRRRERNGDIKTERERG